MSRIRKFSSSEDYVICLECGKDFISLNYNHLKFHNLTTNEYREKYNLAKGELMSRELRLERQKSSYEIHKKNPHLAKNFKKMLKENGDKNRKKANKHKRYPHISRKVGKSLWEGISKEERSKEWTRRNKIAWSKASEKRRKIAIETMKKNRVDYWKGKKKGPMSDSQKKKISETLKGRFVSEETRKKMSEAHKGKPKSEETKRKLSEAQKGRVVSEEVKRKISESHKGKKRGPLSDSIKKKISETQKGRKRGPMKEWTKKKLSKSLKGRDLSKESREKISNSLKNYWKQHKKKGMGGC